MRKLAIIHFNPIEMYPPVLNWLNYISGQSSEELEVRVYTMALASEEGWFVPATSNIRIIRAGHVGKARPWKRYLGYLFYYLKTLLGLIGWRPGHLLYYETISSLPALLYRKYFSRRSHLLIHYHEYTSPREYEEGMVLTRRLHKMEKKMYSLADWFSQTNEDRITCFKKDQQGVRLPAMHVLPNYPPGAWRTISAPARDVIHLPLRIVYIGALSLDTMYTQEFADWVLRQSGAVRWDIYTNNMSGKTREFLQSTDRQLIRHMGAVDYFSLPAILKDYDVGVILYKGHIPNYVYNAPNKLFEYLACGLDVWFPHSLKGSFPYLSKGTFPKVISLDFANLSVFEWREAVDRGGLVRQPSPYYSENVLGALWDQVIAN